MKQLKYFVLGALAILLIPIFDKFSEVIFLWFETLKIKPTEKILNHKKNVLVLNEFLKPTHPVYDDMDDGEDEDYEE